MMRKTDTADDVPYYRNPHRTVCKERLWYFESREGDRGPYESREIAESQIAKYVDIIDFVINNKSSVPADIDWTDITVIEFENPPR
jgi:hypothetical protein